KASFRKNGVIASDGKDWPLDVEGLPSKHSLSFQPPAKSVVSVSYTLDKDYDYFLADVMMPQGVLPKQTNPSSPLFYEVAGEGKSLWKSKPCDVCGVSERVKVPVKGIKSLELRVFGPNESQSCLPVWIEPRLISSGGVEVVAKFNPRGEVIDD